MIPQVGGLWGLRSGAEVQKPLAVRAHDQRRLQGRAGWVRAFQESDAGKKLFPRTALAPMHVARLETQRGQRSVKERNRAGRRKLAEQQGGIEGLPMQLAKAAQQPQEILCGQPGFRVADARPGHLFSPPPRRPPQNALASSPRGLQQLQSKGLGAIPYVRYRHLRYAGDKLLGMNRYV